MVCVECVSSFIISLTVCWSQPALPAQFHLSSSFHSPTLLSSPPPLSPPFSPPFSTPPGPRVPRPAVQHVALELQHLPVGVGQRVCAAGGRLVAALAQEQEGRTGGAGGAQNCRALEDVFYFIIRWGKPVPMAVTVGLSRCYRGALALLFGLLESLLHSTRCHIRNEHPEVSNICGFEVDEAVQESVHT